MNAARPSDGLLPAGSTIAMVELLARRPDGTSVEHLLKDLAATNSISWSRARNTVAKLLPYGLFETEGKTLVRLAPAARSEERRVGRRWVSPGGSRGWRHHNKRNKHLPW